MPALRLECIQCEVVTGPSPEGLLQLLDDRCRELAQTLALESVSQLPAVRATRVAYKAAGKDPARYRPSAEALLRRVVKGEELYRISNGVDLLNYVSVSTGFSIGGYDAEKIRGKIRMGIGREEEIYYGIGRGLLNIGGLPVLRDEEGVFGSFTSDSVRTSLDDKTRRFLMVIPDFGGSGEGERAVEIAAELLERYADATNLEIKTIR